LEEVRMKRLLLVGLALTLGMGYSLTAFSQAKPEVLVKQRQAVMILQGKYFYGQLRPMGEGKRPYDAKRALTSAEFLDALSDMPWDGFQPTTKDVPSRAMESVYTNADKFKAGSERLREQARKLVEIIKSDDENAAKEQILAINKTCSGCHRDFRSKQ
jgi:cytochrome c556